ncbi:MAG: DUF6132 family protein [Bacteroidales bacterium]
MNPKIKQLLRWIMAVLGAIGGFLYWKYVGCLSGHCPLQQDWMLSSLWGASLGYLIGDMFKKKKESNNPNQ